MYIMSKNNIYDSLVFDDNTNSKLSEDTLVIASNDKIDYCTDITSGNVPTLLEEIELQIDRLKRRWNEFTYLIGQRLKYINENKLYRNTGYNDFATYVKVSLKMSENNAYYYIAIYDYFTEEQTKIAGSKLKLIIPLLNRVKRDDSISKEKRDEKIIEFKEKLYSKIYNKSYRDAEKIIKDVKHDYFNENPLSDEKKPKRYIVKKDRIIIYEDNEDNQRKIIDFVNEFYD